MVRSILTALAVLALAAVVGYQSAALELFSRTESPTLVATTALAWVLLAVAFVLLRRVPRAHVLPLLISGSLVIGGAALLGPPNTSTDSARYAWDGIVAGAGLSPYDHVPVADELADLRVPWLIAEPDALTAEGKAVCEQVRVYGTTSVPGGDPLCTSINRPHVPTIYPPLAELYFAAVRLPVADTVEYAPFQVGGLLISLGVTAMLIVALRRRAAGTVRGSEALAVGGAADSRATAPADLTWVALWAWSPFVASEAITNSHVDALGVLLALAASLLIASGRRVWGGIALGAAIATKLIPVIVAPPLLKRRPFTVILVSIVTFAALYVPYVVLSGPEVIGYLPGYLSEEGYEDGSRFALLSLVLPGNLALVAALVIVAVVAGLCWWKADPTAPWVAQLVLIGTVLVVLSPRYSWYALLLVPFVVLSRRWEWLAIPLALTVRLLVPSLTVSRVALAVAVVIVVAGWWIRRRRALDHSEPPPPVSVPMSGGGRAETG
ncbi:glycosyltransferase family 87 protein [Herbiconiux sp. P15]|uniref:glycosyltransferase family 87 protein n=1 Tax=Herbiconiux liukaitaii TaxID=3342799 RepID=UPI0035B7C7C0